jgi:Fe-S-cluster-containing hydrogenase component 2
MKFYKKLALGLDKIPNGFPATESGVELKILEKLFSPEEARVASHMDTTPKSSQSIADALAENHDYTYKTLKTMVKKGLIEVKKGDGQLLFKLIPFMVGFYERQNAQIDKEFAELFETYYHEAFHKVMTIKPSVHRIIPVQKAIPVNVEVMPYEQASTYIEEANSWGVLPCICRVQKRLLGEGCHHTEENCLVFSHRPALFDRVDTIKAISKEEALDILSQADKEGLIHSTNNVQQGVTYICNCCSCSCGILRAMAEYGTINSIDRSDFYATIDNTLCTGCQICLERCQFKALKMDNDICQINRSLCYGCGLCVTTCPTGAITLKKKSGVEKEIPPQTESDWRHQREIARKSIKID